MQKITLIAAPRTTKAADKCKTSNKKKEGQNFIQLVGDIDSNENEAKTSNHFGAKVLT